MNITRTELSSGLETTVSLEVAAEKVAGANSENPSEILAEVTEALSAGLPLKTSGCLYCRATEGGQV